ncbi:hypothetical protein [Blastopirellula marina]|uniref:SWIM-type domain-containing protein n=1 Tax=Blastopirellula marina TaxID=124 RepID=A0A2S8G9C6_9BACT|nr:hypothetical protein [Blastopirellula marina]PQO41066.1 hypothetical protein C5Y98_03650 [Blastopirellula marina]PTL45942.1 hypothetical protein C5Y97_03650 [Blastopirellula marina]
MSENRPKVSGSLVATIIESAPDRVRRRLDRSPDEAMKWDWQFQGDTWQVDTGGETVYLAAGEIRTLEEVRCTCLLSPNCFHVMACLTVLETQTVEPTAAEPPTVHVEEEGPDDQPPTDALSDKQRQTAQALEQSVARVLQVGVSNAGVTIQAGLQRSVHQCRAVGLHRAASLGIRVISGVTQFRARSPLADPPQLIADLTDLLETAHQLTHHPNPEPFWLGTARREQFPVRPKRLHGLLAEPVVSRSGHAGAIAWFLGEDGNFYSGSDVRPGEIQLARDAYRGGIEIGPLIQPGRQLARGLYVGSQMTASTDGRLGRGKKVKLVQQGDSSWQTEIVQQRFAQPLSDQWHVIYRHAATPEEARPAGWNLTFVQGALLGASGPELLLRLADTTTLRLGIANDDEALEFRGNLTMLSHAPGLRVQVIGRTLLEEPTRLVPLAISSWEDPSVAANELESLPQLELPESFSGRVMLGFDKLLRKHIRHAQAKPVVFPPVQPSAMDDPLSPLARRALSAALAGIAAPRQANVHSIAQETAQLQQYGFATAAGLLHTLTLGPSADTAQAAETFLAVQLYLRGCRYELARARASFA